MSGLLAGTAERMFQPQFRGDTAPRTGPTIGEVIGNTRQAFMTWIGRQIRAWDERALAIENGGVGRALQWIETTATTETRGHQIRRNIMQFAGLFVPIVGVTETVEKYFQGHKHYEELRKEDRLKALGYATWQSVKAVGKCALLLTGGSLLQIGKTSLLSFKELFLHGNVASYTLLRSTENVYERTDKALREGASRVEAARTLAFGVSTAIIIEVIIAKTPLAAFFDNEASKSLLETMGKQALLWGGKFGIAKGLAYADVAARGLEGEEAKTRGQMVFEAAMLGFAITALAPRAIDAAKDLFGNGQPAESLLVTKVEAQASEPVTVRVEIDKPELNEISLDLTLEEYKPIKETLDQIMRDLPQNHSARRMIEQYLSDNELTDEELDNIFAILGRYNEGIGNAEQITGEMRLPVLNNGEVGLFQVSGEDLDNLRIARSGEESSWELLPNLQKQFQQHLGVEVKAESSMDQQMRIVLRNGVNGWLEGERDDVFLVDRATTKPHELLMKLLGGDRSIPDVPGGRDMFIDPNTAWSRMIGQVAPLVAQNQNFDAALNQINWDEVINQLGADERAAIVFHVANGTEAPLQELLRWTSSAIMTEAPNRPADPELGAKLIYKLVEEIIKRQEIEIVAKTVTQKANPIDLVARLCQALQIERALDGIPYTLEHLKLMLSALSQAASAETREDIQYIISNTQLTSLENALQKELERQILQRALIPSLPNNVNSCRVLAGEKELDFSVHLKIGEQQHLIVPRVNLSDGRIQLSLELPVINTPPLLTPSPTPSATQTPAPTQTPTPSAIQTPQAPSDPTIVRTLLSWEEFLQALQNQKESWRSLSRGRKIFLGGVLPGLGLVSISLFVWSFILSRRRRKELERAAEDEPLYADETFAFEDRFKF